jgi:hypothetical protein
MFLNDRLSYVVCVPLMNKGEFRAYHFMPVTIPVTKSKQIYIRPSESILCVDKARQYHLVPTLNRKNARRPQGKGMYANGETPYCLV